VIVIGTGGLHPPDADSDLDRVPVDLGDAGATLLGAVMDDPLRHDLRRLAELNVMTSDPELAPALERHREGRDKSAYRTVPYVAVAPEDGDELARTAMEVFRANHGSLLRTFGDPDLQVMHRLLGSDSPLQGELLSYLMFDSDFFAAASSFGHRDARRWIERHPDLWRTEWLPGHDY
jgi:NTE family protein